MKKAASGKKRGKKRGVCEVCGGPIGADRRSDSRYCSDRCRQKAFYQKHTAEKIERVSRYQRADASKRRKFMREYMRQYRQRQK
jgi:hypothetical protein